MPELPEIRAHAARLNEEFAGRRLEKFTILSISGLKTAVPPASAAHGEELDAVSSRGKFLLLRFPSVVFTLHLMQGGRLRPEPAGKKPSARPRGGVGRWLFDHGSLLMTEPGTEHRAGIWTSAVDELPAPLTGLGPEADEVDVAELRAALSAESGRVHNRLRDQHALAGIGRRLANEICHRAQMSPFATTARMSEANAERLHDAVQACLAESAEFETRQSEMVSVTRRPSAVHGRTGLPCPVCGDLVRAVEYRSHTVNYCPTCQTDGKVLSDNTTSKFLK